MILFYVNSSFGYLRFACIWINKATSQLILCLLDFHFIEHSNCSPNYPPISNLGKHRFCCFSSILITKYSMHDLNFQEKNFKLCVYIQHLTYQKIFQNLSFPMNYWCSTDSYIFFLTGSRYLLCHPMCWSVSMCWLKDSLIRCSTTRGNECICCCQAQPQLKLQFGLIWLYSYRIQPPTHPTTHTPNHPATQTSLNLLFLSYS